ncbi:MAG: helix-turn-helix domain-containing protein [Burkholderiaceae bacterium]|nr:helix-turn-helix domain-containing protein [Burkholderiaceae bacterium]
MKTLQQLKSQMLANPETRKEYDALNEEFGMARELIAARASMGLTQADVAQRMGTTQSAVARLESGKRPPSLRSVQRYAQAIGCRAVVRLEHA